MPDTMLASRINRALWFEYVSRTRLPRTVRAVVLNMIEAETEGGAARVRLACREDGLRNVKTFDSHRILSITDPVTGEITEDPPAYLAQLLRDVGGRQPTVWPVERLRTQDLQISFATDGHAVDWVFNVSTAFCAALDVKLESGVEIMMVAGRVRRREVMVWTRGMPPALGFAAGDIIHAHVPEARPQAPQPSPAGPGAAVKPRGRGMTWAEEKRILLYSAQVIAATPDRIEGRNITPGHVTARITTWRDGEAASTEERAMTQADFAQLLRDGP